MLLLLSKYRMKIIPIVDLGEQKIDNIITQSAIIHMLEECADLQWFNSLGSKKLLVQSQDYSEIKIARS